MVEPVVAMDASPGAAASWALDLVWALATAIKVGMVGLACSSGGPCLLRDLALVTKPGNNLEQLHLSVALDGGPDSWPPRTIRQLHRVARP